AVVDGGRCQVGLESTIVRIDLEQVEILRSGMITRQMLENSLGETILGNAHVPHDRPCAPGSHYLHYSPAVASVQVAKLNEARNHWHTDSSLLSRKLDFDNLTNELRPRPKSALSLTLSDEPEQYAQELYGALYECEASPDRNLVIIEPPSTLE